MFDNLRDDSSFYEDEQNDPNQEPQAQAQPQPIPAARGSRPRRRNARFMGMTAPQRFVLSIMLLVTVCVMGVLGMVLTGRMGF